MQIASIIHGDILTAKRARGNSTRVPRESSGSWGKYKSHY